MKPNLLRAGALTLLILCSGVVAAAQTIFVVRHAERTGEPDPPLNDDGRRRAEALARTLVDAGVTSFLTSETIRARQTAEPTARQAGRTVEVFRQTDIQAIAARARSAVDKSKAALVVGHRSTVPKIVQALGGGEIAPLRADEHNRLLVVTLLPGGKASVATLRYEP
jgi:phosphohistidine phosphatase SixA